MELENRLEKKKDRNLWLGPHYSPMGRGTGHIIQEHRVQFPCAFYFGLPRSFEEGINK